ncbi:MAG: biotin-requiring enzyme [Acidobacteria bacterium]|jgi:biotin carboxyl carrier protein|nr:biotin-requiring enzyme [Acidobacteriota bacterium]
MATEIHAPMVGKVVNLLVEPGSKIEEDEPILTLEAMKMEMPIVSPVNGVLKAFHVKVGDQVENDALLATIEE